MRGDTGVGVVLLRPLERQERVGRRRRRRWQSQDLDWPLEPVAVAVLHRPGGHPLLFDRGQRSRRQKPAGRRETCVTASTARQFSVFADAVHAELAAQLVFGDGSGARAVRFVPCTRTVRVGPTHFPIASRSACGHSISAKSPCRPLPEAKRAAPSAPSLWCASSPFAHSRSSASRTERP